MMITIALILSSFLITAALVLYCEIYAYIAANRKSASFVYDECERMNNPTYKEAIYACAQMSTAEALAYSLDAATESATAAAYLHSEE